MNAQQVNSTFESFVNAVALRQTVKPSRDNELTLSFLKSHEKAVKAGMVKFPESVIKAIADNQATDKQASDNFVAVKVNVKIVHALAAFGQGLTATFDKYSNSIIRNLIALQGIDNLNAQRSICSRIEVDELEIAKAVKVYHNCSPSTASTQTSSTREMLRHLDIVTASKRAKGDTLAIKDTKHAQFMVSMFA